MSVTLWDTELLLILNKKILFKEVVYYPETISLTTSLGYLTEYPKNLFLKEEFIFKKKARN